MSLHVVLCRRLSFSVKVRAVAVTGVLQVRTETADGCGDMQLQSELEVSAVNGLSSMDYIDEFFAISLFSQLTSFKELLEVLLSRVFTQIAHSFHARRSPKFQRSKEPKQTQK